MMKKALINISEEYLKFVDDLTKIYKYGPFPNVEVVDDIMYLEPWHKCVGIGIDLKEAFIDDFQMKCKCGLV